MRLAVFINRQHLSEHARATFVSPRHQPGGFPVHVALVLKWMESGQHRDQQVIVARASVTGVAGRKLKTFGPLPVLDNGPRSAVLFRCGWRATAAEDANRVGLDEDCCTHE